MASDNIVSPGSLTAQSTLKVGIAQLDCELAQIESNLDRHIDFIHRASEQGVELLLFPELSLSGYDLGHQALDVARTRDDPLVSRLAQVAPEMIVVFGLVEEGPAAQLYNTALAVHGGGLLYQHRKLNLPTYGNLEEGKLFAAGHHVETFTTGKPWRHSVLICADLWNPALVHLAMLHGTTLMLAPVNSAIDAVGGDFSNPDGWRLATRFYAMMYGTPILMANRIGREGDACFWGGSCIIGPTGEVLAEAGDEENLLTTILDFESVRRARFQLPTIRDSNSVLVSREMQRLVQHVGVLN